jgi:hypothetical protein
MHAQAILSQVENFGSFVYGAAILEKHDDDLALVVEMKPCRNSRVFYCGCGRACLVHDQSKERSFEFVQI